MFHTRHWKRTESYGGRLERKGTACRKKPVCNTVENVRVLMSTITKVLETCTIFEYPGEVP